MSAIQRELDAFTMQVYNHRSNTSVVPPRPEIRIPLPAFIGTSSDPMQYPISAILHSIDSDHIRGNVEILPVNFKRKVLEHRHCSSLYEASQYADGRQAISTRVSVDHRWNVRDPITGRVFPLNCVVFEERKNPSPKKNPYLWHDMWVQFNAYASISAKTLLSVCGRWRVVGIKGGPEWVSAISDQQVTYHFTWDNVQNNEVRDAINIAREAEVEKLHAKMADSKKPMLRVCLRRKDCTDDYDPRTMVLFVTQELAKTAPIREFLKNIPRLDVLKRTESWHMVCHEDGIEYEF